MQYVLKRVLEGNWTATAYAFAWNRLKRLQMLWGQSAGPWRQHFEYDDCSIDIEHAPPDYQQIRIKGRAGVFYEFFTSEHIADSTLASPGFAGPPQYVVGSATKASFPSGIPSPRYSSVLTPGVDDTWNLLDGDAAQTADTQLVTWRSWQNQKFFEHCWWPDAGNDGLVTSTQAQSPGWANTSGWLSPYRFGRFGNTGSWSSDTQLDVRPSLYTKGGVISAAPLLENAWTWWRRAAVQSSGGRAFFISTDNFGRFQIYRVKDYGADAAAIPTNQYKLYTPPYPAWVTVPDVGDYRQQLKQWLWRFNKDATKCVAIPVHSADTDFLKYQTTGGSYQFCSILPEDVAGMAATNLTTAQEDTPGLVEFGIAIEVTGDGDMDFTATFTLLRESYFPTSGRFFFDAAYFLRDVEHPALLDGVPNPDHIATDALMTAEVECLVPPGYYTASVSNAWASSAYDAVRQMRAAIVLSSNDADMVATERLRFTAFSPCWMQFPTIAAIRDSTAELEGLPTTTPPGAGHTYQSAGPGRYDPDSHAVVGNPWSGPLNIGASKGFLYALELATLAVCYEVEDEVTATTTIRGVAYGEEFYRLDVDLNAESGQIPIAAPVLLAATDAVPSARAHQAILNIVINTDYGQGFNVHPAGHWSFNLGGIRNADSPLESDLDWISAVGTDGARTRYRHKTLYNSAFTQTRDYSYYHPDPTTGLFTPPIPEIVLADYGSFRTAGFWVTFR